MGHHRECVVYVAFVRPAAAVIQCQHCIRAKVCKFVHSGQQTLQSTAKRRSSVLQTDAVAPKHKTLHVSRACEGRSWQVVTVTHVFDKVTLT